VSSIVHQEMSSALAVSGPYASMLENISNKLPATIFDAENFNKSASQFKSATLDVTDLTPINTAKHLLATITRTRQALEEAQISLRRKRNEREKYVSQLSETYDKFEIAEIEISIDELDNQIANTEALARGAIRKLHFSINQYQAILEHLGVEHITEEMYEADQARFHVMTAFNQALTAARAKGGFIDEGNQIYMFQLGINGAVAQAEVTWVLRTEQELMADGKIPTHKMITNWLEACADKYANNSTEYAVRRGLILIDRSSLVMIEEGAG
jgi:hypothetical protein